MHGPGCLIHLLGLGTLLPLFPFACICMHFACIWMHISAWMHAGLLQNDLLADINSIATEVLANIQTVQTNGAQDIEMQVMNKTFFRAHSMALLFAAARVDSWLHACVGLHACICMHLHARIYKLTCFLHAFGVYLGLSEVQCLPRCILTGSEREHPGRVFP